jgi:PKD repeat protein
MKAKSPSASSERRRLQSFVLVLLLGLGLVPASAMVAQGSTAALQSAALSPTHLSGFNQNLATVRVGGELADAVAVTPRAARTVSVQYRRSGSTAFSTAYTGKASALGSFTAYLKPPASGTWQFRLVVVATTQATGAVSPLRTVRATGTAATTTIAGFVSTARTLTAGATVTDAVSLSPKAARTVEVQSRKVGTTTWVRTSSSGSSSAAGAFTAIYRPTVGAWQYRLFVRPSPTARSAVSLTRTLTAKSPVDTTAPGQVTALAATVTDTSVTLTWVNPTAPDFTGVTIRRAVGPVAPATRNDGTAVTGGPTTPTSYADTGLTAATEYSYSVFAHDGALNYAVAATWTGSTDPPAPPDTTAPGPVTALITTVTDSSIKLTWVNPTDADFTGVTIRRLPGDVAPATVADGTPVAIAPSATATSFTDTGLTAVTQYSYAVFAHDGSANYAAATAVTGWTNATPPGPTAAVLAISPPLGLATTRLTVNGSFDFDASLSYASPGQTLSTATLDYGDGTAAESFTGDSWSWIGTHAYSTTGPKTVTLAVTDSAGITASSVVAVTVFGAPTANIARRSPAEVDVPVTFGLTSSTPAGTAITDYDLSVIGPNGAQAHGGPGPVPATKDITFTSPGTYQVQLSVSNDAGGTSAVDSMTVDVAGAGTSAVLSTSSYGVDTTEVGLGTPIDFDASLSYAGPAGVTVASALLDFGDGTAAKAFTGDRGLWRETHAYAAAGTYPATLTVTDSANVTVSTVVSVTVSAAPTAAITIEGNPTGSVQVGVPVTFTLTSSIPAGATITSWTLYGDWLDGGYGTDPPATVTHTFDTPGTYTVRFDVTNDATGLAQSSMEVTVVP